MAIQDENFLRRRLAENNAYFSRMVNLVPAELYLPKDDNNNGEANAKYFKNKRQAAPKQLKKEESKRGKKMKFDPANMKTVTELQTERAAKEKEEKERSKRMREDANKVGEGEGEDSEDENDGDSDGVFEESEEEGEEEEEEEEDDDDAGDQKHEKGGTLPKEARDASKPPGRKGGGNEEKKADKIGGGGLHIAANNFKKAKESGQGSTSRGPLSLVGTTPRAKSIEELRERLRLKIEEARAKRGGVSEGGNRRSAKNSRAAAAAANLNQNKRKKGQLASLPSSSPTTSPAAAAVAVGLSSGSNHQNDVSVDIQFGKIAVPASVASRHLKKGGKNLVGLLKKAEEKEKRLKELQATEGGKEEASALLWRDALKSAHGEKILDNPKLLKKAIKKKEKAKAKSKEKWGDRTAKIEAAEREKQGKREANLKKRKLGGVEGCLAGSKAEKDNKEKSGGRQGRAGFEGKRADFLNEGAGKKRNEQFDGETHFNKKREAGGGSASRKGQALNSGGTGKGHNHHR